MPQKPSARASWLGSATAARATQRTLHAGSDRLSGQGAFVNSWLDTNAAMHTLHLTGLGAQSQLRMSTSLQELKLERCTVPWDATYAALAALTNLTSLEYQRRVPPTRHGYQQAGQLPGIELWHTLARLTKLRALICDTGISFETQVIFPHASTALSSLTALTLLHLNVVWLRQKMCISWTMVMRASQCYHTFLL